MPATGDGRRKVLISAYACEPGKGSEPGAGWLWALAAARTSEVWVLTRANNRQSIERHGPPPAGVTFVYLDLPPWLTRRKPQGRLIRSYYVLWQLRALVVARQLHRRHRFDVVHHLTFANLCLPALVAAVDAPFVLGPVGGGQRVARTQLRALGLAGTTLEAALRVTRRAACLNPVVRFAWHRAAVILVNNEETIALLPRRLRRKAVLRPAQCVPRVEPAAPTPSEAPPVAIFGGRLHRFKGLELAIRAVASLPDWRLRLVGDGADAQRLRTLAARLGVASRVEFVPPVPQETLWQLLAAADAFVLPSLKEGGGFAAVEAAALGLPVVAFDQGGPAAIRAYYETDRFHLVPAADGEAGIADALRRLGKRDRTAAPLAATDELVSRDLDLVYGTVRGSR